MRRVMLGLVVGVTLAMGRPCAGQDSTPPRPILYMNASGGHGVLADGHATTLPGWEPNMSMPVWAPTGGRWAYAHGDKRTHTMSLEVRGWTGHSRTLFTAAAESFSPDVLAWAPDGARLATVLFRRAPAEEAVGVFDVAQAKLVARYSLPTDAIEPGNVTLQWSPDGRKILVVDGLALLIDLTLGSADTLARDVITAQWAPGSDGIYYVMGESVDTTVMHRRFWELYHRRLDAPAPVKLLGRDSLATLGLEPLDPHGIWTASPSGTKLVVWATPLGDKSSDSSTSVVYLYDLSKGAPLALEHPARTVRIPDWWIVRPLEWSPDEQSVAMFGVGMKKGGGFAIRLLDARVGTWRTVTQVNSGEDGDVYLLTNVRLMSWTR